jgi:hypothetical protein
MGNETMDHPSEARDLSQARRQASVARDLEVIFADKRSAPRTTAMVKTVDARRRQWFSPAHFGLGVLALAGASAGVALFVGEVLPTKPTIAITKIPSVHTDAPGKRPPIVDAAATQATLGAAVTTSAAPLPLVSSAARTPIRIRETRIRVVRPVPPSRYEDVERSTRSEDGCDGLRDQERAWCMRPSLLVAHRQLSTAYEAARRVGVDSGALTRIQRRWTKLQRRAADRPDDTIDGYRELRLRLLDLIDEQRSGESDW